MKNKRYWFLTVYHNYKVDGYTDGSFTAMPRGCRSWGFFSNKEDALEALRTNMTDLWEYTYDYAVLEPYFEGINGYDFDTPREWFQYNREKNSYEPIKEPKGVEHYYGFALG